MTTVIDGTAYIKQQADEILAYFDESKDSLYVEVNGNLHQDDDTSNLLPGYKSKSNQEIIKKLSEKADLSFIYCINAKDIIRDKQISQKYISFEKYIIQELKLLKKFIKGLHLNTEVNICLTMLDKNFIPYFVKNFEQNFTSEEYNIYYHYIIENYPENTETILSEKGYGANQYIKTGDKKKIVIISDCGGGGGKSSVCLSQIYHDHNHSYQTEYAKLQTISCDNFHHQSPTILGYIAAKTRFNSEYTEKNHLSKIESKLLQKIKTTHIKIEENSLLQKSLSISAYNTIQNYLTLYKKLLYFGHGEEEAITKCELLLQQLQDTI